MRAGPALELFRARAAACMQCLTDRCGGERTDEVRALPLALGQALPTVPLALRADLVIPVDFEAAYAEACLRKRLTGS